MIYLDYTAHTPADPRVLERFCEIEREAIGNANARHAAGREAKAVMDAAIAELAALTGALPEEVVPLSGASEANNLAIKGIARAMRHRGRHMISTPLEHASASGALTALQEQGWEIDLVRVDRNGAADLDHLRQLMRPETVLVAVCAVDSELGAIQPVGGIAEIVKAHPHCRLHVDATQAVGKLPCAFDNIDTMSFSAHKFGGLLGAGALLRRADLALEPLIHGGGSTTIYRSGTPAPALTASTALALRLAAEHMEARMEGVRALNQYLREKLGAMPGVSINSPALTEDGKTGALPHILNLSVDGVRGTAFRDALDQRGVCVSVKSACSVELTPSRAVMAVCGNRARAMNAWRVSLSHLTTREEIDGFLDAFEAARQELSRKGPSK